MSIQSVCRAFEILELLSGKKQNLGISAISKAVGLTTSTTYGIVRTLVELGYLCQDEDTRKYSLGIKAFEVGNRFLYSSNTYLVAASPCHRLASETGLTTRLALWDRDTVVILLNIEASAYKKYSIGPRISAYCSGLGKAILSTLSKHELESYLKKTRLVPYTPNTIISRKQLLKDIEKTRLRGYAIDLEEALLGVFCLGTPIYGHNNKALASISISGGPELLNYEKTSDHIKALVYTSTEISHSLGYQPTLESRKNLIL